MRSNVAPVLLLIGFLVLAGGLVYLAHHPQAEILDEAQSWPFIGSLATRFRDHYATPPPQMSPQGDAEEIYTVRRFVPVVPPLDEGEVWVLPGQPMRSKPSETSPTMFEFAAIANVRRLEKRGDWYRIWHRGSEGWVYLKGYMENGEPPYGRDALPPGPLPPLPPDPEALQVARDLLIDGGRSVRLGPWELLTDSDDDELIRHLAEAAEGLEDAYIRRFSREPLGTPLEVVVLYQDEAPYREVQNRSDSLLGLAATGHTSSGLSVFFVGDRSPQAVASTLVHELVHTINRRALGPALPPWLDEGLAEDLATSQFGPGGPMAGTLGGERRSQGHRAVTSGGLASLWQLRELTRSGRLPSMREVLELDWVSFVRPEKGSLHYGLANFWVRFLLDEDEGRYAESFRTFLDTVAAGGPVSGEALRRQLGDSWMGLDARFALWIEFHKYEAPRQND
jgi:hypothetical protein